MGAVLILLLSRAAALIPRAPTLTAEGAPSVNPSGGRLSFEAYVTASHPSLTESSNDLACAIKTSFPLPLGRVAVAASCSPRSVGRCGDSGPFPEWFDPVTESAKWLTAIEPLMTTPVVGVLRREGGGGTDGAPSTQCWEWMFGIGVDSSEIDRVLMEYGASAIIPAAVPSQNGTETVNVPHLAVITYGRFRQSGTGYPIAPLAYFHSDRIVQGKPAPFPQWNVMTFPLYPSGTARGTLTQAKTHGMRLYSNVGATYGAQAEIPPSKAPSCFLSGSLAKTSAGAFEPRLIMAYNIEKSASTSNHRLTATKDGFLDPNFYFGPFVPYSDAYTGIAAVDASFNHKWTTILTLGGYGTDDYKGVVGTRSLLATEDHVWITGLLAHGAGSIFTSLLAMPNNPTEFIPTAGSAARCDFGGLSTGSSGAPRPFLFRLDIATGNPYKPCDLWIGPREPGNGVVGTLLDSATLLRVNLTNAPASYVANKGTPWGRSALPTRPDGLWEVIVFCGGLTSGSLNTKPILGLGQLDPAVDPIGALITNSAGVGLCLAIETSEEGFGKGRLLWAHTMGSGRYEETATGVVGGHLATGFNTMNGWLGAMENGAARGQGAAALAAAGDDMLWVSLRLVHRSATTTDCFLDGVHILPNLCSNTNPSSVTKYGDFLWYLDPGTGTTLALEHIGDNRNRHSGFQDTYTVALGGLLPPVSTVRATDPKSSLSALPVGSLLGVNLLLVGSYPNRALVPPEVTPSYPRDNYGYDSATGAAPRTTTAVIPDAKFRGKTTATSGVIFAMAPRPVPVLGLQTLVRPFSATNAAFTVPLVVDGVTGQTSLYASQLAGANSGQPWTSASSTAGQYPLLGVNLKASVVTTTVDSILAAGSGTVRSGDGNALSGTTQLLLAPNGNGSSPVLFAQSRWYGPIASSLMSANLSSPPPPSSLHWYALWLEDAWGGGPLVVFPIRSTAVAGQAPVPTAGFVLPTSSSFYTRRNVQSTTLHIACDALGDSGVASETSSIQAAILSSSTFPLPAASQTESAVVTSVQYRVDGGGWVSTAAISPTAASSLTAYAACSKYQCPATLNNPAALENICGACLEKTSGATEVLSGRATLSLVRESHLSWRQWEVKARCCNAWGQCSVDQPLLNVVEDVVPPITTLPVAPPQFDRSSTSQFVLDCTKTDSIGVPRSTGSGCSFQYRASSTPFSQLNSMAFASASVSSGSSASNDSSLLLDDIAAANCLASVIEVVVEADLGSSVPPSGRSFRVISGVRTALEAGVAPLSWPPVDGPSALDRATAGVVLVNTTRVGFRIRTVYPSFSFFMRVSASVDPGLSAPVPGVVAGDGRESLFGGGEFFSVPLAGFASIPSAGGVWTPNTNVSTSSQYSAVVWLDDVLPTLIGAPSKLVASVQAEGFAAVRDDWTTELGVAEPAAKSASVLIDTWPPALTIMSLPNSEWAYDPVGSLSVLPPASGGFGKGESLLPTSASTVNAEMTSTDEQLTWWGKGIGVAVVRCESHVSGDPAGQPCVVHYRVNSGVWRVSVGGALPIPATDVVDGTNLITAWAVDALGNRSPTVQGNWTKDPLAIARATLVRPSEPVVLQQPPVAVLGAFDVSVVAQPTLKVGDASSIALNASESELHGVHVQAQLSGAVAGYPGGASDRSLSRPALPNTRKWEHVPFLGGSAVWRPKEALRPGLYRMWLRSIHRWTGVTSQSSPLLLAGVATIDFAVVPSQRFQVPPSRLPLSFNDLAIMAGSSEGATAFDALAAETPAVAAEAFVPLGALASLSQAELPCIRLAATQPSASAGRVRDLFLVLTNCSLPATSVVSTSLISGVGRINSNVDRPSVLSEALFPQCAIEYDLSLSHQGSTSNARSVDWGGIEFQIGTYNPSSDGFDSPPGFEGVVIQDNVAPGAVSPSTVLFDSDVAWAGNFSSSVAGLPNSPAPGLWQRFVPTDATPGKYRLQFAGVAAPPSGTVEDSLLGAASAQLTSALDGSTPLGRALRFGHTWRQGMRISIRRMFLYKGDDVAIVLRARRSPTATASVVGQVNSNLDGVAVVFPYTRTSSNARVFVAQVTAGKIVQQIGSDIFCSVFTSPLTSGTTISRSGLANLEITMYENKIILRCPSTAPGNTNGEMTLSVASEHGLVFSRRTCGTTPTGLAIGKDGSQGFRATAGPLLRLSQLPFTTLGSNPSPHVLNARAVCRGVRSSNSASFAISVNPQGSAADGTFQLLPQSQGGPIVDGKWKIEFLATDSIGNAQIPANATSHEWIVDTQEPVTSISVRQPTSQQLSTAEANGLVPGVAAIWFASSAGDSSLAAAAAATVSDLSVQDPLGPVAAYRRTHAQSFLGSSTPLAQRGSTRGIGTSMAPIVSLARNEDITSVWASLDVSDLSTVDFNVSAVFVPGVVLSPSQAAQAMSSIPSTTWTVIGSLTKEAAAPAVAICLPRLPADVLTPGWPAHASVAFGGASASLPTASCAASRSLSSLSVVSPDLLSAAGVDGISTAKLFIHSVDRQVSDWQALRQQTGGSIVATAQGTVLVRAMATDFAGNTELNAAVQATTIVAVDRSSPRAGPVLPWIAVSGIGLPIVDVEIVCTEPWCITSIRAIDLGTGSDLLSPTLLTSGSPSVTDSSASDGPRRWNVSIPVAPIIGRLEARIAGGSTNDLTEAFLLVARSVDLAGNRGEATQTLGWVDRAPPVLSCGTLSHVAGHVGPRGTSVPSLQALASMGLDPQSAVVPILTVASTTFACNASEPIFTVEAQLMLAHSADGSNAVGPFPVAAGTEKLTPTSPALLLKEGRVSVTQSASALGSPQGSEFASLSVEADLDAVRATIDAMDPATNPEPPAQTIVVRLGGLGESPRRGDLGTGVELGTVVGIELRATDAAGNVGNWFPIVWAVDRHAPVVSPEPSDLRYSALCPKPWTSRYSSSRLVKSSAGLIALPSLEDGFGNDLRCSRILPVLSALDPTVLSTNVSTLVASKLSSLSSFQLSSSEPGWFPRSAAAFLPADTVVFAAATARLNTTDAAWDGLSDDATLSQLAAAAAQPSSLVQSANLPFEELARTGSSHPLARVAQTASAVAHRILLDKAAAAVDLSEWLDIMPPLPGLPELLPALPTDGAQPSVPWPLTSHLSSRAALSSADRLTSGPAAGKRGFVLDPTTSVSLSGAVLPAVKNSVGVRFTNQLSSSVGYGVATDDMGVYALAVAGYDMAALTTPRSLALSFAIDRTPPRAFLRCVEPQALCQQIGQVAGAMAQAPAASSNSDPALWTSGFWETFEAEATAAAANPAQWASVGRQASVAASSAATAPFANVIVSASTQLASGLDFDFATACDMDPLAMGPMQASDRWQPGGYLDDRCVVDVMLAYSRHPQARTPPPVRTAVIRGVPPGSLSKWTATMGAFAGAGLYSYSNDSWRHQASPAQLSRPTPLEKQADESGPTDGLWAVRTRGVDAAGNAGAWTPWLRWSVDTQAPNASAVYYRAPRAGATDSSWAVSDAVVGDLGRSTLGASSRRGARAYAIGGSSSGPTFLITCGEAVQRGVSLPTTDLTDLGGGCHLDMSLSRLALSSSVCGDGSTTTATVDGPAARGVSPPVASTYIRLSRGYEGQLYSLKEVTEAELDASAAADVQDGVNPLPSSPTDAFGKFPLVPDRRRADYPADVLSINSFRFFRLELLSGLTQSADSIVESLWLRSSDAAGNQGRSLPFTFRFDNTPPPPPRTHSDPVTVSTGQAEYRYEFYSALDASVNTQTGQFVSQWRRDDASINGVALYGISSTFATRLTRFVGALPDAAEVLSKELLPGQFRVDPEACAYIEAKVREHDMSSFDSATQPTEGAYLRFQATYVGKSGAYSLNAAPSGPNPAGTDWWSCATGPIVLTNLPHGKTTLRVLAVDAAGNVGQSADFFITVTADVPTSRIITPPPALTSLRRVAFSVEVLLSNAPTTDASVTVVHNPPGAEERKTPVFYVAGHPNGALSAAMGAPSNVAVVTLDEMSVGRHSVSVFAVLGNDTQEASQTRPAAMEITIRDCSATEYESINSNGTLECQPCPQGGDCTHPRTSLLTMPAKAGWWSSGKLFSTPPLRRFYRCPNPVACPGGTPVRLNQPAIPPREKLPTNSLLYQLYDAYFPPGSSARRDIAFSALVEEQIVTNGELASASGDILGSTPLGGNFSSNGNDTVPAVARCLLGYAGFLCSQCSPGFFSSFQRCEVCPAEQSEAVALTSGIVVGIVAIGALFLRLRRFLPIVQAKAMLAFAQILAATVTAYDIPWPSVFTDTVDNLRVFVLDVVSATRVQCSQPVGYSTTFHVQVTGPLVIALLIILGGLSASCRCRHKLATLVARLGCLSAAASLKPVAVTRTAMGLWGVALDQRGGEAIVEVHDTPRGVKRAKSSSLLGSTASSSLVRSRMAGEGPLSPSGKGRAVDAYVQHAASQQTQTMLMEVSRTPGVTPPSRVMSRESTSGQTAVDNCKLLLAACCLVGPHARIGRRISMAGRCQLVFSLLCCCGRCCRPKSLRHGGSLASHRDVGEVVADRITWRARKTDEAKRLVLERDRSSGGCCRSARFWLRELWQMVWIPLDERIEPVRDLLAYGSVLCCCCATQSTSSAHSIHRKSLAASQSAKNLLAAASVSEPSATETSQSLAASRVLPLCAACCLGARSSLSERMSTFNDKEEPPIARGSAYIASSLSWTCLPCERALQARVRQRESRRRQRGLAVAAQELQSRMQMEDARKAYFAKQPRERVQLDAVEVQRAAWLRILLLFGIVVFAPVSLACLRMLRCVDVDGIRRLGADLRQPCSGVGYQSNALYAVVVLLVFTAGFPIALVSYIRRNLVALRSAAAANEQERTQAEKTAMGSPPSSPKPTPRGTLGSKSKWRVAQRSLTVLKATSPVPAATKRVGVLDQLKGESSAVLERLVRANSKRNQSPRAPSKYSKRWDKLAESWVYENHKTGKKLRERPDDYVSDNDNDDEAAASTKSLAGTPHWRSMLTSLVYAPSASIPDEVQSELFQLRRKHAVMLRVGSMYEGYTPRAYWWEAEELIRRLALSALIVLVPKGSALQVAVAALVAAGSLALLTLVEPYQDPSAQQLQQLAFITILFVFWTGMLLKTDAASAADRAVQGGATDVDSAADALVLTVLGFVMVALTILTIVTGVSLFVRDTTRNMLAANVSQKPQRKARKANKSVAGFESNPLLGVKSPAKPIADLKEEADAPPREEAPNIAESLSTVRFGLHATKSPTAISGAVRKHVNRMASSTSPTRVRKAE
jgi:hypothetical protein